MEIASVRAAAIRNPASLSPTVTPVDAPPDWVSFEGHPGELAPPWPDVACVITATDGTFGFGTTAFSGPVVPIINEHLAPLAVGHIIEATDDLTRLWDLLDRACASHYGSHGLASFAISAVDLALWDLFGKTTDRSVVDLLGGPRRSSISTYATGVAVQSYLDLGHRGVKLPLAGGDDASSGFRATRRALDHARALIGSELDLMLDGWAVLDADGAAELGRETADLDLRWIEDAVFPEDWAGYGRLRAALPEQPLAAGERWHTARPFVAMAGAGTVDVLQPDPCWVGGVTPMRRIADVAAALGLELAIHCGGNDPFGQHLSMALPAVSVAEVYYGGRARDAGSSYRSFCGGCVATEGMITANEGVGFGFELSLAAIEAAC